jgi:hypothetical protein
MGSVAVFIMAARRQLLTFRGGCSEPGSAFHETSFENVDDAMIGNLNTCVQNCNLNRIRVIR